MTWASGRARGRYLLLLAAAVGAIALALASVSASGRTPGHAGAAARAAKSQSRFLLRLHDLQIGYFKLFAGCSPLAASDDTPRRLATFYARYKPAGCLAVYLRSFEVEAGEEPDPFGVGSGVLRARSDAEADAAWSLVPLLLSEVLGSEPPEEVPATATIGDATRMFHSVDPLSVDSPASFVVWRSGNTLAAVYAGPGPAGRNDRDAIAIARRQQAHTEVPTPYTAAERDDSDSSLDDPEIKLPVYWLGRDFHPAVGLPDSHLLSGQTQRAGRGGTGPVLSLEYTDRLGLTSWAPDKFKRFLTTPESRRLRAWPCTVTSTVTLPQGRTRVYAGYKGNPDRCPRGAPDAYGADVFLDGAVVHIDPLVRRFKPIPFGERPVPPLASPCRTCPRNNPPAYDSRRGVLAVARALALRTPRPPRGVPVP